jgi:hypothetical protein
MKITIDATKDSDSYERWWRTHNYGVEVFSPRARSDGSSDGSSIGRRGGARERLRRFIKKLQNRLFLG